MSTTNEQELREVIRLHRGRVLTHNEVKRHSRWTPNEFEGVLIGDDIIAEREIVSIITAYTNAEIAKVLDRLELGMRGKTIVDTPEGWKRFVEIYVNDAIEAERAKLKEGK